LRRKGEFTALDYGKLLADATQSSRDPQGEGEGEVDVNLAR
jgi:hypothetical protein